MKKRSVEQDYIYCLACSPSFEQDGLIFAAKKSGLYRSTDSGRTWKDAYSSLKLKVNPPTVFAAVTIVEDLIYVLACVEGKILRSLDAGVTWKAAELGSPAPVVTTLVVSPNFAADGTLLAATMQDGIFCSSDRGITWTGWNFGLFDPNVNTLDVAQNSTGQTTWFAGTQSCIFTSTNAGRSWDGLEFPIDRAPVLCLAAGTDGKIYAGTESEGLYCTKDDGKTWMQLIPGAIEHIIVDKKDHILVLSDGELLLSKDQGRSWRKRKGGKAAITCFVAPLGLGSASPLLIGSSDGEITSS